MVLKYPFGVVSKLLTTFAKVLHQNGMLVVITYILIVFYVARK